MRTETVAADSARLTLDIDSLLKLPEGAAFHTRSGRASLTVGKGAQPGTIFVRSSCDSLRRLVEYYERREQARSSQADSTERSSASVAETTVKETKKTARPWLWCALTFIAGITAGIVLTLKIKKRK